MEEMDSVLNDFDMIRQRAIDLENQNERLERDINGYQDRLNLT